MFLVVVAPFGARERGDAITDADEIKRVLADNADKVVRVGESAEAVVRVGAPDDQAEEH